MRKLQRVIARGEEVACMTKSILFYRFFWDQLLTSAIHGL